MIKHLNFEEEKAKCLAKSKKVIYDKSYFIGNTHTEDGVEAYGCAENGFVFIHKAYVGFESED